MNSWSQRTAARVLDANANRAREALRVLEEYARFGLGDASCTAALKALRHELVAWQTSHGRADWTLARDAAGDVGKTATQASEYQRADVEAIVGAAAGRLTEALRAIEEYAKLDAADAGAAVEQLRYRAYELEQRLSRTQRARTRWAGVRLYVLITEALCAGDWFETAAAALRGGARALQLREKGFADRELLARAQRLVELCRASGALCFVNDRPDIAAAAGADGVHLGQDDLPLADARGCLPPTALAGLSTHSVAQVESALEAGPDYVAVGPMFATATKPSAQVAGPALLAAARARTQLPIVAIGGITAETAPALWSAGADCVCVCGAVVASPDPEAAARRLVAGAEAAR